MARTIDLAKLKRGAEAKLSKSINQIDASIGAKLNYLLLRWMCRMTAVAVHAIWERYVEDRLVAALNHDPQHFLQEHSIKGVKHVSYGLATYVIRGGARYFDFRSMDELISKANRWLGRSNNRFATLPKTDRDYIDALAAIRNFVVHESDAAFASYKRQLRHVYGVRSVPTPEEFLHAKDFRATSPCRYNPRLHGVVTVIWRSIQNT